MPTALRVLLALSFALAGCAEMRLTRTAARQPPRPEDCTFKVFFETPLTGFAPIAIIDAEGVRFNQMPPFRKEIRPIVCKAGGDAVIAYVNGDGYYIKATILKRTGSAGVPVVSSSPPAPAPSGCQYDTQCKGERVCVQGACVDPAPSAPSAPAPPAPTPSAI